MNAKQMKRNIRKAVINKDTYIKFKVPLNKLITVMSILTTTLGHDPSGTFKKDGDSWIIIVSLHH